MTETLPGTGREDLRWAKLSQDGAYRYVLGRRWGNSRYVWWVMLNPSTADAREDDATIRRCMSFAGAWGCGGICVLNLYALRATDPRELDRHHNPVGPENDACLMRAFGYASARGEHVVAGWGANPAAEGRALRVRALAASAEVELRCLGRTKDGAPRHPLYLPSDSVLEVL